MASLAMINPDEFEQEIIDRGRLAADVLDNMSGFVSPPEVYFKINSLLNLDDASATDFATVMSSDPNLTARLLRIVNSPYYAPRSPIDTVVRAIPVIGMRELANLVCSVCAVQSFSKISANVTDMKRFWRHSVYCGVASKVLATELNLPDCEQIFVTGILHDVGTLVINDRFPELAEKSILDAAGNESVLADTERRWLGFNHAEIGAMIMRGWGLSETVCDAIQYHHQPEVSQTAPLQAAIIQVGGIMADHAGFGGFAISSDAMREVSADVLKILGQTDPHWYADLSEEVGTHFSEVEGLLTS